MAGISHIEVGGFVIDLPTGTLSIAPQSVDNQNSPESVSSLVLANGDNVIPVPSNSVGVLIVFDASSGTTKKLKGVGGDTGVTILGTGFAVLFFEPGALPANFIINSSAADVGKTTNITFF